MPDRERAPGPAWLRLLGAAVIALMGAGMTYSIVIALMRFPAIGV